MTTCTTRRPTTPATGTCRWLENAANGNRMLRIATTTKAGLVSHDYEVVELMGGYLLYRLDEAEGVVCYNVTPKRAAWTCDCPDATKRRDGTGCKHAKALRAALNQLPF